MTQIRRGLNIFPRMLNNWMEICAGWQHEEHEQYDDACEHDAANALYAEHAEHAEHADDAILHDACLHAHGNSETMEVILVAESISS